MAYKKPRNLSRYLPRNSSSYFIRLNKVSQYRPIQLGQVQIQCFILIILDILSDSSHSSTRVVPGLPQDRWVTVRVQGPAGGAPERLRRRLVGTTPHRRPPAPCRGERGSCQQSQELPKTPVREAFSTAWLLGRGMPPHHVGPRSHGPHPPTPPQAGPAI